jgi:hypothetical protein
MESEMQKILLEAQRIVITTAKEAKQKFNFQSQALKSILCKRKSRPQI